MSSLSTALICATLAGAAIPAGGLLARWEDLLPNWLEDELRHSIIAFGGGILLAAIALVLVPDGLEYTPGLWGIVAFGAGGLGFFAADYWLARRGGSSAQLMAMMLDFIPEAMALGAAFALHKSGAVLLALLIALQNLPEAFNAAREISAASATGRMRTLLWLGALVPLGPLSAWLGHEYLSHQTAPLGFIMLFASGGILYLTFEDIAPQSVLKNYYAPPLGAVAGFLIGLIGDQILG